MPYAISNESGITNFYLESHGGFTNSLIAEFTRSRDKELKKSHFNKSEVTQIQVETKSLDDLLQELGFIPDFIKIDVEGAELLVLGGGSKTLSRVKGLMIEVSSQKKEVFELTSAHGFLPIDSYNTGKNTFL